MDFDQRAGDDGERPNAGNPVAERILTHARRCFQRAGVRKTTIEDIAGAAGLARQTVYNHFSSKQDIVDRITLAEMIKVQEDLRQRMRHCPHYADKVTEAVLMSAILARENPFLQRIVHDLEASPKDAASGPIYEWHRDRWRPAIDAGRDRGELADLDIDDITTWLSLSQLMMQIRIDRTSLDEDELRRFIRRFIVEPLLSKPAPAAGTEELAELRRQAELFSEIAEDQAKEIKALKRTRRPKAANPR